MNAPIRMPVADEPILWPIVSMPVTADDSPADPFAEKQMRLLTEPLYASWPGPGDGRPFRVLANVGLYERVDRAPLVPDVMLGVDTRSPEDLLIKGHRAWFTWIVGKSPTAVIEIVSNLEGGEDTDKVSDYADLGVPYYIIHDPLNQLKKGVLRGFALREGRYAAIDPRWLPNVGLGLVLWHGTYEDVEADWLRWCDKDGTLIMTGAERAAAAEMKAKSAEERAERLAAQLRKTGRRPIRLRKKSSYVSLHALYRRNALRASRDIPA